MSSTATPALSVLDLVPVRTGQTSAQAIASSMALAATADRLGYRRYWFAEHHNMPAVASTTPPVLVAAAASRTSRIRVGSGGVMLPNHSPLVVAEQFAALEAIAPSRIDLGLGRAPGSDPVITQLLRQSGTTSDVERFPENVRDIAALVSPAGAGIRFSSGGTYDVHATPAATGAPELWLLGSSDYSAQLAASLGLPYVFANHFSGQGLERALELYRTRFQPSEEHPAPRTFLTVNAIAAPTSEEAEERSLPNQLTMMRLRTNKPLIPAETVEQARASAATVDAMGAQIMASARSTWFVGTGEAVASQIRAFAAEHGVDEVMVSPIAGAYDGEPLDASPGRAQTLDLIAAAAA
ncbi:LLM class flavin-dependent oxidoreductase [Microbacterium thalassium]|uniref:Luciferase family oxidoreductase group 1 n=1 Tax=Microbacterium thalassium TaxID=362649 RepID=A0A7X0FNR7_9MICO|nr:LLM class flavin-dependent oxidoreductase [Microbacterium thalassium]MBB6390920.1 luciferase family oxidoreductase group 1 [Microbacterium thalassium]GLK26028.1 alkanal monooxygenase subunit alpha [Microbacterium thalassium]